MKAIHQTIQALRSALKDELPLSSLEKAAEDYAHFCSEAEQRLDRVAAMLQKGSDYQALQVAEEEPPLLDLAALLSFGEEKNWQIFCEKHGFKVAPRLNAKTIENLEALYAKGISANHPLYKDFRAAVLSRDDLKSLRIVKTILKLNPTDDNARQELLRLENKQLQEKIDQLREALKTDDEERIATLTEAIKAAAPAAKLERMDAFQQGDGVRAALRKRQAEDRLPGMLAQMSSLQAENNWREVGHILETVDAMMREHGLKPADETQEGQLAALIRYHQKETANEEKRRAFERCLKGFMAFVEEVETRLLTGAGVTYTEIAEKDETFVRRWKELEGYQLPVANDALQRLRAAGQELRAKLERMQRAQRLRNIGVAAAVLLSLLCISAIGLHAWKAYSLTQELAAYKDKESCVAAEDLIKKLRSEEELLLRWPYLQAKIEEVNAWTHLSRTTEKQADEALQMLEQAFQTERPSLPLAQLVRQLKDAEALVKQLAGDLAAEPGNRLAALQSKTDLHLAVALKELTATTGASLAEVEQMSSEQLSYEKLAASVTISRQAIEAKLQPLESLLKPEVAALQLPADLETRLQTQRQRLDSFNKDLESFAKTRAETAAASSFDDFKKALAGWQEVKFVEAAASVKMLDTLPTEQAFLAALFTSGDQDMLKAILADKSGRYMSPNNSLEADQRTILSLMRDENLNGVFENTLGYYSRKKSNATVWSRGKPQETAIGNSIRWTANFYEPDSSAMAVLFIQRSFTRAGDAGDYQGDAVISSRLSLTSEFMNVLGINRITDEKGERIMRSLLEVFENLVKDIKGSPIAKAYVMLKLEDMLRLRPHEWGLHYCPSLQQDLRELHRILGTTALRSEDWLVPAMRESWVTPLTAFFKTCKDRFYMKEAVARRDYLRAAASAGLKYAGYVETDLSLVLNQAGRTASELWVISKDHSKPLLVSNPMAGTAATDNPKQITASSSVPLGPVFLIPIDRKQLIQQFQNALSSNGVEIKPLPGESLYLAAP